MSFEDEIKNHHANRKLNILKGFREVDDYFEKAKNRQVGETHPKKPNLVWTEYKPGKFDWRNAKSGSAKKNKSANSVKKEMADKINNDPFGAYHDLINAGEDQEAYEDAVDNQPGGMIRTTEDAKKKAKGALLEMLSDGHFDNKLNKKSSSKPNSTEKVNTKVTYEDGEVVKLNPDADIPDDLKDLIGKELDVPFSRMKNDERVYTYNRPGVGDIEIPQNLLKVTNKLKTVSEKQAQKRFNDAAKRIKKEIGTKGDLNFNENESRMQITLYYGDNKRQVANKLDDLVQSVQEKEFGDIKRKIKVSEGGQYIKERGYGMKTALLKLK